MLWRSIDSLMGRGHAALSDLIDADKLHQFFDDKVDGVDVSTAAALPPTYTAALPGCLLSTFREFTADDVTLSSARQAVCHGSTSNAPSQGQHRPASIVHYRVVPSVSLYTSILPVPFKSAYITPLLKKPGLDPADPKSYRPISNLLVLSKTLERLVARRMTGYLCQCKLMPDLQSAYRVNHLSTETAVLWVLFQHPRCAVSWRFRFLSLLYLSAVFDTVDHPTPSAPQVDLRH